MDTIESTALEHKSSGSQASDSSGTKRRKRLASISPDEIPETFKCTSKIQEMVEKFLQAPQCTPEALALFLVVFCARKQESHSLDINEAGQVIGTLKRRGQELAFDLVTCVGQALATAFMRAWRAFPGELITAAIRKLESVCTQLGFANCAMLRLTGAWLTTKDIEDAKERKTLFAKALRNVPPKPKPKSLKRRMSEAWDSLADDIKKEAYEFIESKRSKHAS